MENPKIVNLTPHSLIFIVNERRITIVPSGIVPRVKQVEEKVKEINVANIPFTVTQISNGEVEGLPEPQANTIFIVSQMVANASEREDLFFPFPLTRDEQGRVIGAAGLGQA